MTPHHPLHTPLHVAFDFGIRFSQRFDSVKDWVNFVRQVIIDFCLMYLSRSNFASDLNIPCGHFHFFDTTVLRGCLETCHKCISGDWSSRDCGPITSLAELPMTPQKRILESSTPCAIRYSSPRQANLFCAVTLYYCCAVTVNEPRHIVLPHAD